MKRNLVLGAGLALVVAVALLANCRTARAPSAPAAVSTGAAVVPRSGPATAPVAAPKQAELAASEPAPAPIVSTAAPSAATGTDRLADRRGLARPETTPALEAMRRYERDEMVLIAQVQKRTRRSPPPGVEEIIQARRSGASFEELWALADRKLGGDAEMLLAVRAWLNEVVRPRPAVPDGSPPSPRGAPLELGGSIAPK